MNEELCIFCFQIVVNHVQHERTAAPQAAVVHKILQPQAELIHRDRSAKLDKKNSDTQTGTAEEQQGSRMPLLSRLTQCCLLSFWCCVDMAVLSYCGHDKLYCNIGDDVGLE